MTNKRKWRWLIVAVILIAVAVLHAPILRGLAGVLIVDQPTDNFDCVCVTAWGHHPDGDRCYDVAADLYRDKPSRSVLIVAPGLNRLEQIGAVPSFESMSRRELSARGVPQEALSLVVGGRWNLWANARSLDAWLRDHPGKSVLLLTGQFHSAQLRSTLDAILEPADAARVFVRALPSRRCDETNWWTRRCGYRAFAVGWLMRLQGWLSIADAEPSQEANASDYQRDFLQTLPAKKS